MKASYTPLTIKRVNHNSMFPFLIDDYGKKLWAIIIILLPLLFFALTGKAQQLTAMLNTGHAAMDVNASVDGGDSATDNSRPVIASKTEESQLVLQREMKRAPSYLPNNESKAKSMVEFYFKGIDDADSNYRTRKSCRRAIFLTTLIGGPVVGIVPTVACSATTPNNTDLNIPGSTLVGNDAYMRGYKGEAHYIKKHNTWPIYILTSIVWIAAANLILR